MNKLSEMIEELCPEGVEWRKLGEVCYFENGYALNAKEISQDGRYPCIKISEISNGKIQIGKDYIDELPLKIRDSQLLHGNEILVAMSGSTGKCGFNYNLKNAIVNQRIGIIRNNDKVLTGYLKHCLVNQNFSEYCLKNGTGPQNNVTKGVILNFLLPLPPLAVQQAIVGILDKFDALNVQLEALLEAEKTAREKQYAYYRDKLLTFDSGVEWRKLGEVCERLRGTPITAAKMKEIAQPNGNIKIFAGGKTEINTFEENIPNANITRVPAVLVQSRGIIDFIYYDKPFTFKNEMWAYTCDNIITVKYLYYILKNNTQKFRDAASKMGSLPQISLHVTDNFLLPLPPLAVQQAIVGILDKFDALNVQLEALLEAEKTAREKQYAYYRDKLLSFKQK